MLGMYRLSEKTDSCIKLTLLLWRVVEGMHSVNARVSQVELTLINESWIRIRESGTESKMTVLQSLNEALVWAYSMSRASCTIIFFEIGIFKHQIGSSFEFRLVLVTFSRFGGFSATFFNKVSE